MCKKQVKRHGFSFLNTRAKVFPFTVKDSFKSQIEMLLFLKKDLVSPFSVRKQFPQLFSHCLVMIICSLSIDLVIQKENICT